MKIAFLTELPFQSKVSEENPNARTEFAWMYALDADHYPIVAFDSVENYDHVFIIFPKGSVFLNSIGVKLTEEQNPTSQLLDIPIIEIIKSKNNKVHFIQEGPHWLWNDYEIKDQVNFYNLISTCDSIFCHNESDINYYKGLFSGKPVNTIKSLMVEFYLKDLLSNNKQDKVIIGGNFSRWYGGFESYSIACSFEVPIWTQTSHATRNNEDKIDNLNHLPRLIWKDWMQALSEFKYAVHMMPTVAAGTFSLNCAYFGIPCIGNKDVDTQRVCHPQLSVDVNDIYTANNLALKLKEDVYFYNECSLECAKNYKDHYDINTWKLDMIKKLKSL